jgi:hypothetical protein
MSHSVCAHPGRGCPVDPAHAVSERGVLYCSDYCAKWGIGLSGECKCGHKQCNHE